MSKRIYYEDIIEKESNPYLDNSNFEDMKNLDDQNPFMNNMVYPDDETLCSKFYHIFCCCCIFKFSSSK